MLPHIAQSRGNIFVCGILGSVGVSGPMWAGTLDCLYLLSSCIVYRISGLSCKTKPAAYNNRHQLTRRWSTSTIGYSHNHRWLWAPHCLTPIPEQGKGQLLHTSLPRLHLFALPHPSIERLEVIKILSTVCVSLLPEWRDAASFLEIENFVLPKKYVKIFSLA